MTREEMLNVDIRTVPLEELEDISCIQYIDSDNITDRVDNIKKQLNNLYVHRNGNVAVMNEYTEGKSINEVFGILVAASF
ncbi:MAG: hypothetical protein HFH68_11975 [Lachnospiraceae bacterium]|nr:hypothetical protein [Lachnospiraceae bacterium]